MPLANGLANELLGTARDTTTRDAAAVGLKANHSTLNDTPYNSLTCGNEGLNPSDPVGVVRVRNPPRAR